jgi:hypothetical protein
MFLRTAFAVFGHFLRRERTYGLPIVEFACNEGNYGMTGILARARAQEKAEGR